MLSIKINRRRSVRTGLEKEIYLCTGALPRTIEEYAALIKGEWHESFYTIMRVAKLCAEADACLTRGERLVLLKMLPFDRTRFEKLAKIGSDRRLADANVQSILPPHHSILYELANLNDAEFNAAVEQKVIHPKATRKEIVAWRKSLRGEGSKSGSVALPKTITYGLKITSLMSRPERGRLDSELLALCERFGIELIRRATEEEKAIDRYERQMGAWSKRVNDRIMRYARKRVAELKKRTLASGKVWGFLEDEISIDCRDGVERVCQVLDTVGIPDELEKLRERATHDEPMPEFKGKLPEETPEEKNRGFAGLKTLMDRRNRKTLTLEKPTGWK
jgi:hypothetical protein